MTMARKTKQPVGACAVLCGAADQVKENRYEICIYYKWPGKRKKQRADERDC